MRELLTPHVEELVANVVEMAKGGDTTALRICVDRLMPAINSHDEAVTVPGLIRYLGDRRRAVLDALASGELTPEQAGAMLCAIGTQARIMEIEKSRSASSRWNRTPPAAHWVTLILPWRDVVNQEARTICGSKNR